jgi:1-phosphofructokinase family hexose kinase
MGEHADSEVREPVLHVVGANPALDRLQVVRSFVPFGVNRAHRVVARAGGKSLIVGRAIRRLSGAVALYGFIGGPVADVIAEECRAEGIEDRHTRIDGDTRTTVVLVEESTGRTTVINEPGPNISEPEVRQMEAALLGQLLPGDFVLLTGSLPPGVPADLYAGLIQQANAAGCVVLVDASGDSLVSAAAAGPQLLKINSHEFQRLAPDCDVTDADELLRAMEALRKTMRIASVIVTRGKNGCLAIDGARRYTVSTPLIDPMNPTGSGDAFFGALALTLARQRGTHPMDLEQALRIAAAAGAANASRLDPDIGDPADVHRLAESVHVEATPHQLASVSAGKPSPP